eukprot:TRINITY_DN1736_c0_g1_i1.p1 TRINITY_DN1736_c0_g1~~TRINITY_DN1736_c0_g1_i1.p1  ORF type:complete len:82 (+),score=25.13 TRINITY_DN1736_c0_g1_i1:227-472(+)
MELGTENKYIKAAREALEQAQKAIQAYELEKARLEKLAKGKGVKALGAKNELAQLHSSPLVENLNTQLIKAEAALKKLKKI